MSVTRPTLPASADRVVEKIRLGLLGLVRELVEDSPLVGAKVVGPFTFASGQSRAVPHGLGRPCRFWAPVTKNGEVTSFVQFTGDEFTGSANANEYIQVVANAVTSQAYFLVVP